MTLDEFCAGFNEWTWENLPARITELVESLSSDQQPLFVALRVMPLLCRFVCGELQRQLPPQEQLGADEYGQTALLAALAMEFNPQRFNGIGLVLFALRDLLSPQLEGLVERTLSRAQADALISEADTRFEDGLRLPSSEQLSAELHHLAQLHYRRFPFGFNEEGAARWRTVDLLQILSPTDPHIEPRRLSSEEAAFLFSTAERELADLRSDDEGERAQLLRQVVAKQQLPHGYYCH
jgi:hypothetical protein